MEISIPQALLILVAISNIYGAYSRRPGRAKSTHTCNHVRGVPAKLRSSAYMKPRGLSRFYQKYTEAYGIPVVASARVSDNALRRACYTLRVLLADHPGIRNSYYKMSGRVGIIGVNEGTTNIPEHSFLPPWWNTRARGLGATATAPISTGGEENILCYTNDRYRDEDIFLHEFSHGVHLLGAKYAIPGWDRRLRTAYYRARRRGLWRSTYAMSTPEEYFAEGTQSYFNVNAYFATPNGVHNHVNTRSKLRSYDPVLYGLVKEVFPCGNTYLKRCHTSRGREMKQTLKMDCNGGGGGGGESTGGVEESKEIITTSGCIDSNSKCKRWGRNGECSKNPAYMLVHCKRTCNACNKASCVDSRPADCVHWARRGECRRNPVYMKSNCRKSCGVC